MPERFECTTLAKKVLHEFPFLSFAYSPPCFHALPCHDAILSSQIHLDVMLREHWKLTYSGSDAETWQKTHFACFWPKTALNSWLKLLFVTNSGRGAHFSGCAVQPIAAKKSAPALFCVVRQLVSFDLLLFPFMSLDVWWVNFCILGCLQLCMQYW